MYGKLLLVLPMLLLMICSCGSENQEKDQKKETKSEKPKSEKIINNETKAKVVNFSKLVRMEKTTRGKVEKVNEKVIKRGDKLVLEGDDIVIKGWAVDRQNQKLAKDVYVFIGTDKFRAEYGIPKKSVARALKSDIYMKSGFTLSISRNDLPKGEHQISLRVLTADGKSYYVIDYKNDPVIIN